MRSITILIGKTSLALVFSLVCAANSAALVVTLGDQDFNDGDTPAGVAAFTAPQGGEPPPIGQFLGADQNTPFSASWTFNYAPQVVTTASLTIGIFDHDSQAPGSQVFSFLVDGIDLTATLDGLFESSGGSQAEFNIYSLILPASTFANLSDGSATVSLTLQGPGLGGVPGATIGAGASTTPNNGAGIDFSTLSLNMAAVPEPTTLLLLGFGLAGLGLARKRLA